MRDMMSAKDLMQYLHICRNSAYKLMNTDGFPVIRVGRKIYVRRQDLDEWFDKQVNT